MDLFSRGDGNNSAKKMDYQNNDTWLWGVIEHHYTETVSEVKHL